MNLHGKARRRLYSVWSGMLRRCETPTDAAYRNYGGRGITVCEQWHIFANFYADMGDKPSGLTLERKDNNSGYFPDNCVWASRVDQSRNRRSLVLVTINNETQPLSVWIERYGVVRYGTAHQRIRIGWDAEKAITTPLVTRRKGIPRGSRIGNFDEDRMVATPSGPMPLWQAIEASGLKTNSVMNRLRRGWPVGAALSLPPHKGPRKEAFGANHNITFIDQREHAA